MVESAVGAASVVGVVSVSAAFRSAAAATAAVIASAALAAAATERCDAAATDFSTNAAARVTCAAVLATWTDLWACTATCAICHAQTWTAILCWTGIAIADRSVGWTASVRGSKNAADSSQLASMAALERFLRLEKTRTEIQGPRRGWKCTGAIQAHTTSVK